VRPKAIVFDITGTLRYTSNEPVPRLSRFGVHWGTLATASGSMP
jgi:hypothetical protein